MYFDAAEAVFNAVTKAILSGSPAEAGFGGHYGSNMGLLMTGTTDAPPSSGRRDAAGGVGERLAAATQSIPVVFPDETGRARSCSWRRCSRSAGSARPVTATARASCR